MTEKRSLQVYQFPCRQDNYGLLVYDSVTRNAMSIDSPEEEAILEALTFKGLTLTHILNTHHHYDHVDANRALKERFDCLIIGAKSDAHRIPAIDQTVSEGDSILFEGHQITVIETPGHTLGHIIFWVKDSGLLFVGDSLFSMGCGRLFEGDGAMMWRSLQKIRHLSPQTQIYCAHEYTLTNAEFALELEPENKDLQRRMAEVKEKCRNRLPTLPTSLEQELKTNPFLRPQSKEIQRNIELEGASLEAIFTKIRHLRDKF